MPHTPSRPARPMPESPPVIKALASFAICHCPQRFTINFLRSANQPIAKLSFRSERALALKDQLHTSTLRPGTFEKCLRLFVTTVIPWDTACEAMRRSIFPIGLPERSNSVRIRA
jgi:hypothetical protein